MNKTVNVKCASGACILWDGRRADPGVPLAVTLDEAVALVTRDPDEWSGATAEDTDRIIDAIARRHHVPEPPAAGEED